MTKRIFEIKFDVDEADCAVRSGTAWGGWDAEVFYHASSRQCVAWVQKPLSSCEVKDYYFQESKDFFDDIRGSTRSCSNGLERLKKVLDYLTSRYDL